MKKELALIPSKFFNCTSVGLEIAENTPFEDWLKIGEALQKANTAVQWWIGDWLNFGERKYGEKYSQAIEETPYAYETLRKFANVAKKVEMGVRTPNLSFDHHLRIAYLEPKYQAKWLKEAIKESWSVKELRQAIRRADISGTPLLTEGLSINTELGDFRELIRKLKPNSIDLILTDPPYPKEYLSLWNDLAKETERVLKPSGFLIAYSGQNYLSQVLKSLNEHLEYYWLAGLYHKGPTAQRFEVNMWNRFKPILIYYKLPREKQDKWIEDILISEAPNKEMHEWGQSVEPLITLLETFSKPGDTICDPFFGGGSTIEACIKTKRNFVGYEIDKEVFKSVKKRLK